MQPCTMSQSSLSFGTRIWFAWVCFFRVLFDGEFASRAWSAREPVLLPAARKYDDDSPTLGPIDHTPALQLLALFQREGRLIDFLEQEIASFSDNEIGATARVIHEGCRKALHTHAKIAAIRSEEEGAKVSLAAGFDAQSIKLSGNVSGNGPYKGVLRHKGWRATEFTLPTAVRGHDASVLAQAEVEL
jgi:hypothetical protein